MKIESYHDTGKFLQMLSKESDRGCALIAAAAIDNRLAEAIGKHFVDNKDVSSKVLGQSGPLATFSARIDVGYLLGLYPLSTHRDLHLMRKIRNEFGHVAEELTFESAAIAGRCSELRSAVDIPVPGSRNRYVANLFFIIGTLDACIQKAVHLYEMKEVTDDERREANAIVESGSFDTVRQKLFASVARD